MADDSCCGPTCCADEAPTKESEASPSSDEEPPVVVIGAGPVGLAAAAHLVRRGVPAVVLEAGSGPGAAVREWSHVRLFSPWSLCVDRVAKEMLEDAGWEAPDGDCLPTGGELVERYLEPLAALPPIASSIRYGHRVTGVTREGRDRLKGRDRLEGSDRAASPFVVRVLRSDGAPGELRARAVIDASGTWHGARPLGADGLPAVGEEEAGDRIHYGIPDVRGAERERYVGRRVAVVGAGHSAANTLLDLVRLKESDPRTRPVWILRGRRPDRLFAEGDDELAARGALERRLRREVEEGSVRMIPSFAVRAVDDRGDAVELRDADDRGLEADRVVSVTGFRPDLEILRELRLDLDPVTEAPRELGPLIDPNVHSCGTVPPHGEPELRHPEPGLYVVGMKSYGRAPTFLLPTGYEQVRSVVAHLAGDEEEARKVELVLPETGVCSVDAALAADEGRAEATKAASVVAVGRDAGRGCCG